MSAASLVTVAVCQFSPTPRRAENRARIAEWTADAARRGARLVVFPEYSSYFVDPMDETLAENAERFPTEPGKEIEASEMAMEAVDRRSVLLSDMQAMKAEADALQLVIANYMEDADTLTYEGRRVLTYKTQAGRASFDAKRFKADHPDLAATYTKQGAPFKVMRTIKEKNK